jgi:hypothetical protein
LDVADFQCAMEMFNITETQKKGFPKFSSHKYGSLATEYYIDENGSEVLPSWVKQMGILQTQNLPLYVSLQHNGDLTFLFSDKISWDAENCYHHGVESFFIEAFEIEGDTWSQKFHIISAADNTGPHHDTTILSNSLIAICQIPFMGGWLNVFFIHCHHQFMCAIFEVLLVVVVLLFVYINL